MAIENSLPGRRGWYGGWPQLGVPIGVLLSSPSPVTSADLPQPVGKSLTSSSTGSMLISVEEPATRSIANHWRRDGQLVCGASAHFGFGLNADWGVNS